MWSGEGCNTALGAVSEEENKGSRCGLYGAVDTLNEGQPGVQFLNKPRGAKPPWTLSKTAKSLHVLVSAVMGVFIT